MDLISYAKALQPYISESKKKAEYISVIFSNFIDDDSIGGCSFFELEPDTLSRFLQSRPLPKDHAQYFYEHRDLNKYADWISDCLTSSDAFEHVEGWLQQNGYPGESASEELAQMLEQIVLSICKQSSKRRSKKKEHSKYQGCLDTIARLQQELSNMPEPTDIPLPELSEDLEQPYVNELFAAYGDAENIEQFDAYSLESFPDYLDDLTDRRIDYYSAASVERSVMELNIEGKENQFDVLKREVFNGVKNTARKKYSDGYDRMLSVMEQATNIPIQDYLLRSSNVIKLRFLRPHQR